MLCITFIESFVSLCSMLQLASNSQFLLTANSIESTGTHLTHMQARKIQHNMIGYLSLEIISIVG